MLEEKGARVRYHDPHVPIVRYDGIEMQALDLENITFESRQSSTEAMAMESMATLQESLDTLEEQDMLDFLSTIPIAD